MSKIDGSSISQRPSSYSVSWYKGKEKDQEMKFNIETFSKSLSHMYKCICIHKYIALIYSQDWCSHDPNTSITSDFSTLFHYRESL